MKKLLLLVILTIGFVSCDDSKNFKRFVSEDGYGKEVVVDFKVWDTLNLSTKESLDMLKITSLVDAKYRLKNKLTFVPVELHIWYKKDEVVIFTTFRGKNGFGVEQENTSVLFYSYDELENELREYNKYK